MSRLQDQERKLAVEKIKIKLHELHILKHKLQQKHHEDQIMELKK